MRPYYLAVALCTGVTTTSEEMRGMSRTGHLSFAHQPTPVGQLVSMLVFEHGLEGLDTKSKFSGVVQHPDEISMTWAVSQQYWLPDKGLLHALTTHRAR